jgi:DNA-binding transcriptional LysR family regulator
VELRHLKAFVAVAEELHFGRAAARLQIAQSPLSQSIRTLEGELGVALLDRTTRRVSLRPAGEAFLPRAREAIAAAGAAVDDARSAATGQLGRLRVGFTGSMTYALLPALAKALRAQLPRVALDLRGELLTPEQVHRLVNRELDIGFLRPPIEHADLAIEPMGAESLVVVLPRGHALAARNAIAVGDLENEAFITYPSHFRSVLHDAVSATCAENGFIPTVAVEVGETATLVSFVAAGMGVALVPASAQFMTVTGAVYRPLLGATHSVQIAMCWRRDAEAPALEAAREVIRAEVKALRRGESTHTIRADAELVRTLF